jgi:hypothetical protein
VIAEKEAPLTAYYLLLTANCSLLLTTTAHHYSLGDRREGGVVRMRPSLHHPLPRELLRHAGASWCRALPYPTYSTYHTYHTYHTVSYQANSNLLSAAPLSAHGARAWWRTLRPARRPGRTSPNAQCPTRSRSLSRALSLRPSASRGGSTRHSVASTPPHSSSPSSTSTSRWSPTANLVALTHPLREL